MQDKALQQLEDEDPYITADGPPCDPFFTNLSHMFPDDTRARKLARGMRHLQLVKKVSLDCKKRGAHLLLENP